METNTQENKKKLEELEEAAKPLIKYLCENYHPHVTAIVTPTSVEVMEGIPVSYTHLTLPTILLV